MSMTVLSNLLTAVVGAGGVLYGISRFVAKVDRNTEATERLTASFDRASEKTDAMLADHEKRLIVLETKTEG